MSTSYIPQTDAGFSDWLTNFATLVAANPTAYGLVAADATAITAQKTAYNAALLLATDPSTRTSATVAAKDAAKSLALAVTRPYAIRITNNAGVTDQQRANLGLTIRKTVPTPVPPPTTSPALSIKSAIPGAITFAYKDPTAPAGKAKPFGVIGVQIYASVGTVAATDPAQASYLTTATKAPFVLGGDVLTPGKVVTMFARWNTRSGPGGISQVGPWSSPLVFIAM